MGKDKRAILGKIKTIICVLETKKVQISYHRSIILESLIPTHLWQTKDTWTLALIGDFLFWISLDIFVLLLFLICSKCSPLLFGLHSQLIKIEAQQSCFYLGLIQEMFPSRHSKTIYYIFQVYLEQIETTLSGV